MTIEVIDIIITNRLQELRKNKNITQQELSIVTGIPLTTIQKLEKEQRDISSLRSGYLLKISKALGVHMEELLTLSE